MGYLLTKEKEELAIQLYLQGTPTKQILHKCDLDYAPKLYYILDKNKISRKRAESRKLAPNNCRFCNKEFCIKTNESPNQFRKKVTCSRKCAGLLSAARNKKIVCAGCHIFIKNAHPIQKFCLECGKNRIRASNRLSDARLRGRKGLPPKQSDTFPCKVCGSMLKRISSGHKYCSDCKMYVRREQYRMSNKSEKGKARMAKFNRSRKGKDRRNDYLKRRRKNDPMFRLHWNVSRLINISLKKKNGSKGRSKWETIVEYTLEDLRNHLESKFKPGMTWENYGEWEIDHIKPVSKCKFTKHTDPGFKQCWSLRNLQPLWAWENYEKRDKYVQENRR